MMGRLERADLETLIASGEIDTVIAAFPDMQGRLIGKRVTGHHFLAKVIEEWHACDYLLALDMEMEPVPGFRVASWEKGYGDFVIRPDLGTLRRIPWLPGTALVLGDVVDHKGHDLRHSPRAILKRQVARLAEHGLEARMASELEFYVFDDSFADCRRKGYRDLATAGHYIEDYHILQTTKIEPLMRSIRNQMEEAGIPVEFSKGEWGPGQAELNLVHADALEMADRHVIYKNGVKEIAHLQDRAVSFMAKWRPDLAGSSCHIHCSLWHKADATPAFVADGGESGGRASPLFGRFVAGLVGAGRPLTFFLAPTINSYKRFQEASFAPTNLAWSHDNRTCGFRAVGRGPATRIECRIPGADVNPYLAMAALLAAGLDGIESGLEPLPAFTGDAYRATDVASVPTTLAEAAALADDSALFRNAFGSDVIDHYVHAARWEQRCFDRAVTDWELERYFERG